MKILLSWLNEYADFGADVDALAAAMTSLGLVVDDVEHVGATIDGVVTARVLRMESHPDAARVHRVYVDTGHWTVRSRFGVRNGNGHACAEIVAFHPGKSSQKSWRRASDWRSAMAVSVKRSQP